MASYVVMEPPPESRRDAVDRTLFIRDGFHWLALILPLIWLLVNRLWLEALLVLALSLAIGAAGEYFEFETAAAFVGILVAFWVGLEASALRIAALRRRGWRERGVVEAVNREEAELRYFSQRGVEPSERPAVERPAASVPPAGGAPGSAPTPALGLFQYPGAR